MSGEITLFEIRGLHGHLNLDITLNDNRLILVGENGSGKTSVLRLFFYFLSGQWSFLHSFRFSRLRLCIGGQCVELSRDEVEAGLTKSEVSVTRRFPTGIRERIRRGIQEVRAGRLPVQHLEEVAQRYGIPFPLILEAMQLDTSAAAVADIKSKFEQLEAMRRGLDAQVIYLPTYRRIEEELHLIVRDKDIEEAFESRRRPPAPSRPVDGIELIEFGMGDVEAAIENVLSSLKEFARTSLEELTLGYLGDVVDQKYASADLGRIMSTDDANIERVLNRISSHILSGGHKQHVFQTVRRVREGGKDDHARVICHYLLKLLDFQQQLESKEAPMASFRDVCNRYFGEEAKQFVYDSSNFSFTIQGSRANDGAEIRLRNLSSGEKQIVSLFSHLYLSGHRRFFVIIDEPELSLSVPWQRHFLVDVTGTSGCAGLLAATHSPFVYENDLNSCARGLGEFVV